MPRRKEPITGPVFRKAAKQLEAARKELLEAVGAAGADDAARLIAKAEVVFEGHDEALGAFLTAVNNAVGNHLATLGGDSSKTKTKKPTVKKKTSSKKGTSKKKGSRKKAPKKKTGKVKYGSAAHRKKVAEGNRRYWRSPAGKARRAALNKAKSNKA